MLLRSQVAASQAPPVSGTSSSDVAVNPGCILRGESEGRKTCHRSSRRCTAVTVRAVKRVTNIGCIGRGDALQSKESSDCMNTNYRKKFTLLYPTIAMRASLWRPRSGPAVTGPGDLLDRRSGAGMRTPLLVNVG